MKRRYMPAIASKQLMIAIVFVLHLIFSGCVQQALQEPLGKQDGLPADIVEADLKEGLAAVYFHSKYRHIDEMPKTDRGIAKFGRPGPPILKLDHQFGQGEVFDSGKRVEIGVLMRGYIRLENPGDYVFQAKSNDGFQLYIDGNLVVSDPTVHSDKLSEPGTFRVVRGGWFPVTVRYFQRKGTAALTLSWQPPGTSSFVVVPGGAYGHLEQ